MVYEIETYRLWFKVVKSLHFFPIFFFLSTGPAINKLRGTSIILIKGGLNNF